MSTILSPPIADPEDLLGTYAFLPWLRQGIANAITAPPATGIRASIHVEARHHRHSRQRRRCRSRSPSLKTSRSTAPATSSASTRAPSSAPSRGLALRTSSPTISRPSISTTKIIRGATRPRPPAGLQLSPWIALIVLKQGEYTEGKNIANRPLPFITIQRPDASCRTRPSCGHGRTCTSIRGSRRILPPNWSRPDMSAGDSARAVDSQHQSRPRLLAAALSAAARRQHRLRCVRHSRRLRVAVSRVSGSIRRKRLRRWPRPGPPMPASRSRRTFPITIAGISHRRSRRLPLSGQPAQAAAGRSHGRHARLRRAGSRLESARHRQARIERHPAPGRSARSSRRRPERRRQGHARHVRELGPTLSRFVPECRWPSSSIWPTTTRTHSGRRQRS